MQDYKRAPIDAKGISLEKHIITILERLPEPDDSKSQHITIYTHAQKDVTSISSIITARGGFYPI